VERGREEERGRKEEKEERVNLRMLAMLALNSEVKVRL
jgi:hypothetical protein